MVQDDLEYELSNGSIIQDTYEILAPLGQGGMGSTYKARHIAMGHLVAVKVINSNLTRDQRALDLFKREANLLRDLGLADRSGAIVKIETLLKDKSGAYYLIMEYIEGQPLSYYTSKGARLMHEDLMKLADRLLDALWAIHSKNIVHRDISPDNIMVPNENILDAKILDFGVASDTIGTEKSILGDTFAGKISYASPEQLGLQGGKVSEKSDLYSLGLVLLEAAGIKPPGKGSMAEAIDARREDIDLSDTRLEPEARVLIERLLKADPKMRTDIRKEQPAVAGAKMAPTPIPHKRATKGELEPSGGGKGGLIAVALVVAVVGGAGAWFTLGGDDGAGKDGTAAPVVALITSTEPVAQAPKGPQTTTPAPPAPVGPKVETAPTPKDAPPVNPIAKIIEKVGEVVAPPAAPQPATPDARPQSQPLPSTPASPSTPEPEYSGPDPFTNIMSLISIGQQSDLEFAMRALAKIEADGAMPSKHRARAAFMLGRMNDPKHHSPKVSPLARPNAATALGYYKAAVRYGARGLEPEISRLGG